MSTQFDQVFEGLSRNSLTLEDACRVLYSESQVSPESMRVCCERIEVELTQGRITSDAAQLLLDALGEQNKEDHDAAAAAEELWVDVPLEPLEDQRPRGIGKRSDITAEADLTIDNLLAALHRRSMSATKLPGELDAQLAAELCAPVEWMEWEPEESAPAALVASLVAAAEPGSTPQAEAEQAESKANAPDAVPPTAEARLSAASVTVAAPAGTASSDLNVAPEIDTAVNEVFASRVEHVLKESLPMAAGALLKNRYRIVGSLPAGGLGQLFEAIDTQTSGAPRVSLKLIDVDWQEEPRAFETLQAIVRHVRRLRHPNLLSILDIDRDDEHAIIAMEPLRGYWLSSLMREVRGRGVGYALAWNIISGIANGLAYAHHQGAVHSELNPHMVFLSDTGQVKIAGFELARALPMSAEPQAGLDDQTLRSYADAYCGTHWILGAVPHSADDLYPLGVMAYELLTGAHPFSRSSSATAAGQQLRPQPIPGLDRRIRRVIERCLSFERQDRPQSGASFLARIAPADQPIDLVRESSNRPRGSI